MPKAPRAAIIVPLYLYPIDRVTWQPLHQAISDYPDLKFVIIINPNSGPGVDPDGWLPDKHYSREIPRLTEHDNVIIIGYVRVDYCRRSLREVLEDIKKYANWFNAPLLDTVAGDQSNPQAMGQSTRFAIHGIFFDEVPNVWEIEHAGYLEDVGVLVKEVDGIVGHRLIVHNSGTVPDSEYPMYWRGLYRNRKSSKFGGSLQSSKTTDRGSFQHGPGGTRTIIGSPDITVIFEESSALWHEADTQTRIAELLRYRRANCSYMIHSVPQHLIRPLTREMRARGAYLFITELQDRYYESFGKTWIDFVSAMAVQEEEGPDNLLITIESSTTWIKTMARDTLKGLNCPLF